MYLEFYGLKENPFNVTSDPAFLYMSRAHEEALSHLLYGIKERKGFLEITGEIGAGKTTLCRALLTKLDSNVKTAFILDSNLSELQLLEAIVEDFGISSKRRTKFLLLKELDTFLMEQLKKNHNSVLILDEAQNLKPATLEAIRLLSNLETEKEKLLQIILVGQPELRRKLSSPSLTQLKQRIGVRYHINPLEKDEVYKYINHRLNVAGSLGGLSFTEEALLKIYEYSLGVPRLINIACDKALLSGFVLGITKIDGGVIDKSILEIEGKAVGV